MSRNTVSHQAHGSKRSHKHETKQGHKTKASTKKNKQRHEFEQREAQEKIGIIPTHPSYVGNGMENLSTSNLRNKMEFEEYEEFEEDESFPSRETLREDRDY